MQEGKPFVSQLHGKQTNRRSLRCYVAFLQVQGVQQRGKSLNDRAP